MLLLYFLFFSSSVVVIQLVLLLIWFGHNFCAFGINNASLKTWRYKHFAKFQGNLYCNQTFHNPLDWHLFTTWASACEKSEEKGQGQKVKFVCLNMKENMATGHKSTFLVSLFAFWDFFGHFGYKLKNAFFLRIRF